jgi:hypothetical protein
MGELRTVLQQPAARGGSVSTRSFSGMVCCYEELCHHRCKKFVCVVEVNFSLFIFFPSISFVTVWEYWIIPDAETCSITWKHCQTMQNVIHVVSDLIVRSCGAELCCHLGTVLWNTSDVAKSVHAATTSPNTPSPLLELTITGTLSYPMKILNHLRIWKGPTTGIEMLTLPFMSSNATWNELSDVYHYSPSPNHNHNSEIHATCGRKQR